MGRSVKIQELADTKISGVRYALTGKAEKWKEDYFEWTAFPLQTSLKCPEVVCGLLQGWHHTPVFNQIEYHEDKELIYFYEGTAIIMFCDMAGDKPDVTTAQVVRIPEGTEIEIEAGKAHFVAVAEGETYKAIVVSPEQAALRAPLSVQIIGVS